MMNFINPFSNTPAKSATLLCLTPDDFTCQRSSSGSERVKAFKSLVSNKLHHFGQQMSPSDVMMPLNKCCNKNILKHPPKKEWIAVYNFTAPAKHT